MNNQVGATPVEVSIAQACARHLGHPVQVWCEHMLCTIAYEKRYGILDAKRRKALKTKLQEILAPGVRPGTLIRDHEQEARGELCYTTAFYPN